MVKYGNGPIYADTGCALFPKCLECPFPDCIADSLPSLLKKGKRLEAMRMIEQGMSRDKIAEVLGVSKSQISRYLHKDIDN